MRGAQDSTGGREALSLGPCLPPAALRTPGGDLSSHVSSRYQPYAKDVEAWKIETAGPERPRKKELYAKKGQGSNSLGLGQLSNLLCDLQEATAPLCASILHDGPSSFEKLLSVHFTYEPWELLQGTEKPDEREEELPCLRSFLYTLNRVSNFSTCPSSKRADRPENLSPKSQRSAEQD